MNNATTKRTSPKWIKSLQKDEIFVFDDIAPLFQPAIDENIENVYLPESFWRL
jgi:hypothetical protein